MPPADFGAPVVFRGPVTDRQSLAILPAMRGRRRYAITFRVDEYWKGLRTAVSSSTVWMTAPTAWAGRV
jgi:hypothetical protein